MESEYDSNGGADSDNVEIRQLKRKRVGVACDQCKRSKYKCDGRRPTCSTCGEAKTCTYNTKAKRRGLASGYVRSLETLLGLIFENIQGSETTVCALFQRYSRVFQVARASTNEFQDDGLESALSRWKGSVISIQIDALLSSNPPTISDPISRDEFVALAPERVGHVWQLPTASLPKTLDNHGRLAHEAAFPALFNTLDLSAPLISYPNNPLTSEIRKEDLIGLPADFAASLAFYFKYTHCWMPFVEKSEVYHASFEYTNGAIDLNTNASDSANHAVLWAILAYTYLQYGRAFSDPTVGNAYTISRRLIPSEMSGDHSLGHVQALLILSLCAMKVEKFSSCRLLHGHAILLLNEIGIPQAADTMRNSQNVWLKNTWAACFILDSLLALRMNRIPQLSKLEILQYLALTESGLEEWEPWASEETNQALFQPARSLSVFFQLSQLAKVMNDAARCMNPLQELKEWELALPSHCSLSIHGQDTTLPHIIHFRAMHILSSMLSDNFEDSLDPSQAIDQFERILKLFQSYVELFGAQTLPATCSTILMVAIGVVKKRSKNMTRLKSLHNFSSILQSTIPGLRAVHEELTSMVGANILSFQTPLWTATENGSMHPSLSLVTGDADYLATGMMQNPTNDKTQSEGNEAHCFVSGEPSLFEYFVQLNDPSCQDNQPHFATNLGYGTDLIPRDLFMDGGEYITHLL